MSPEFIFCAPSGSVVDNWLVAQTSPLTTSTYRQVFARFTAWCGTNQVDILEARRPDIDRYRQHLASHVGSVTLAKHLSALASFYTYAAQDGLLEHSPVANVKRPRVANESRRDGLTLAEARDLLAVSIAAGPRDAALVHLLLSTGARVSEACSATVGSLGWTVDGDRGLRVVRKGGKTAVIPIHEPYWSVIDLYLQGRPTAAATPLLGSGETPLNRHAAYRIVSRLAKRVAAKKRIGPHSLRHTAATLALDAGVELLEVQEMLGHANPATTQRYDRARASRGRAASRALGELLARDE
jgi:site-specific recombinase XerD